MTTITEDLDALRKRIDELEKLNRYLLGESLYAVLGATPEALAEGLYGKAMDALHEPWGDLTEEQMDLCSRVVPERFARAILFMDDLNERLLKDAQWKARMAVALDVPGCPEDTWPEEIRKLHARIKFLQERDEQHLHFRQEINDLLPRTFGVTVFGAIEDLKRRAGASVVDEELRDAQDVPESLRQYVLKRTDCSLPLKLLCATDLCGRCGYEAQHHFNWKPI